MPATSVCAGDWPAREGDRGRPAGTARERQPIPRVITPLPRSHWVEREMRRGRSPDDPTPVPYDLGQASSGLTLYCRGLAYLELKSGKEAAAQFQKIVDNRGVVITDSYWPLAHLGLARAYARTGDTEKSLAEYREFLTFWKNADPDLRILKQAKSEYAILSKRAIQKASRVRRTHSCPYTGWRRRDSPDW